MANWPIVLATLACIMACSAIVLALLAFFKGIRNEQKNAEISKDVKNNNDVTVTKFESVKRQIANMRDTTALEKTIKQRNLPYAKEE
jgi:hypothetical protein